MTNTAFSYLRFSTPEQERGDSFRRQRDLAVNYCAEHGLELDGRSFQDMGISGFRGANVRSGALGAFLKAVDDGLVPPGSHLLVESLDRVSRQNPWDALPVFQMVVNAGVVIITLQDRQRYSRKELMDNPLLIMQSVLHMQRAHEESAIKSARLKAAWEAKRSRVAATPLTAKAPAWLRLLPGTPRKFEVVEPRAAVVRRIFDMTLAGKGQHTIVRLLNKEGVPTFGRGSLWQRSYVCKILSNSAVVGEYRPHVVEYASGKRVRRPLDAVEGYYPAIVSRETFNRVQAMRDGRTTPRTRAELRNLLGGLARCPHCGGSLTRVSKGPWGGPSRLACTTARRSNQCSLPSVVLGEVEQVLLAGVAALRLEDLAVESHEHARDELAATDAQIADMDTRIERVLNAIEGGEHDDAPVLVEVGADAARMRVERQSGGAVHSKHLQARLRMLEDQRAGLENERQQLAAKLAAADISTLRARLRELQEAAAASPISYERVNVALRALCSRIVVDRAHGEVQLHWRSGGGHMVLPWANPEAEQWWISPQLSA
ncbi:MAG: recombinase family protein [Hyphomicrobiaceae bacterium]